MLQLIPRPLHRALLKVAQGVRAQYARRFKPQFNGCCVIATDDRGQVLMVRHSYGSGKWCLPAGGLKRGEDPEKCARREMREELDCRMDGLRLVGVLDETFHGAPNRVHVLAGAILSEPRADRREIAEARFFPLHSLPHPLDPGVERRIRLWQANS